MFPKCRKMPDLSVGQKSGDVFGLMGLTGRRRDMTATKLRVTTDQSIDCFFDSFHRVLLGECMLVGKGHSCLSKTILHRQGVQFDKYNPERHIQLFDCGLPQSISPASISLCHSAHVTTESTAIHSSSTRIVRHEKACNQVGNRHERQTPQASEDEEE